MLNKKYVIILLLVLIGLVTVSSVSANNLTDSAVADVSQDEICIDENNDFNDEIKLDDNDLIKDSVGISNPSSVNSSSDETVSQDGAENILESSDDGTFTALQNKINAAAEGSTITLENDYYYNKDFESTIEIKITKSITINGNGHVIDGMSKSSLLKIKGAENVILNDITFQNGVYDSEYQDFGKARCGYMRCVCGSRSPSRLRVY